MSGAGLGGRWGWKQETDHLPLPLEPPLLLPCHAGVGRGPSCSCSLPSIRRGVSCPMRGLREALSTLSTSSPFESSLSPEEYFPPTLQPTRRFREAGPWWESWRGEACRGPDPPCDGLQVHAPVASQAPCTWSLISCPVAPVRMSCCVRNITQTEKGTQVRKLLQSRLFGLWGTETVSVCSLLPNAKVMVSNKPILNK